MMLHNRPWEWWLAMAVLAGLALVVSHLAR